MLADISMPILSGFELLQRLTQLAPRFSNMPFLYLTALADRTKEVRGRRGLARMTTLSQSTLIFSP